MKTQTKKLLFTVFTLFLALFMCFSCVIASVSQGKNYSVFAVEGDEKDKGQGVKAPQQGGEDNNENENENNNNDNNGNNDNIIEVVDNGVIRIENNNNENNNNNNNDNNNDNNDIISEHGDNNNILINNEENRNSRANSAVNNLLLDNLSEDGGDAAAGGFINALKARWNELDGTGKLTTVNYTAKAVQAMNNMILDMINNNFATDYPKYILQMFKGGASAAATVYFKSPAAGAAVESIFDMIMSWFHIGEVSQSELQVLEGKLNDQFDRLSREIEGVKRDVAALAEQINEQTATILSKIDDSFEAYYAKTQITDFLYSTSGNFSYNTIRDYLYSSGRYSLYADLATALARKADDKTVKELYDNLYYALMHYDLSDNKTNVDKFTEYYIGDVNRKSISHYYYEYLSSNQSYIELNASLLAADFASQVYYDYITTLNVVKLINVYQLTELYLKKGDMTLEEFKNARYYYGNGVNDYVTVKDIEDLNAELDAKAQAAYNQLLVDVTDVLALSESYMVEEANGLKRYVTENDKGTFGNLVENETIYLNQVITPYCNRFALDPTLFEYEFKAGDTLLQKNKKLGYYKVATQENFTGSVIYNGTVLFTIRFRVGDNTTYAGGSGKVNDPYVIATVEQYKLMYNDLKKDNSFLLIKDLDFGGQTLTPLGSETYPFNGEFNGAEHTIKNAKINYGSANSTSIFGVIGNSGLVKNLEIESFTVTEDKENDDKKVVAGIIAGINNGRIVSCFIRSSSITVKRDSDLNNDNLNKAITMFVGAIAGENNGIIAYSKVESTSVSAESKRFYSANKDSDNRNNVYAGGIVGANNYGTIESCYVAGSVFVKASGDSEMQEGLSFRYPYMTVQAGGIAGVASTLKTIKNVYSAADNVTTETYVKNHAFAGGSFYSHCNEYSDSYVPNQKDNDLKTIKGANADVYKIDSVTKTIKFEFMTGGDTGAVIDPEFKCSSDLVYVGTDTKFRLNNLKLTLVLNDGETETEIDSCLSIIGIYGFDVKNPDKEGSVKRQLTANIYDSLNNSVYTVNFGYYVRKNAVYKIDFPDVYNNKFDYNSTVGTGVYEALGINEVLATYHDGTAVNVVDDAIFTVDTSELGAVKGKISYGGLEKEIDCTIVCNEPYDREEITILQYNLSSDKEICTVIGYKTSYCSACGKMTVENISKVFLVTVKNAAASTCSHAGYTGDLCILADGIVLFNDVTVEYGSALPMKEHNFNYAGTSSTDYKDEYSHYCIDCHYREAHMFRTVENSDEVICECVVCGHRTSLEINSREEIEKLPRVVVSNAYAVTSTKEVKVFIDLHASTGITAANFSVNFDPSLTLVSYKLGTILNGKDSIDTFKSYSDHINLTLVRGGTDYGTDGTLLTLVFRLPEDPVLSEKYIVEVTNKGNGDKFTDKNGNKTDFIAYSGGIIVVSHLPGDINGDNLVNLVDAVILSNYVTLDSHEQSGFLARMTLLNHSFDIAYGDVNLDGSIDISDAVQILRYTTGGYETTFVSNVFEIALNYDNGETLGSFFVRYDGVSTFGSLQSLPELQKVGYKFDGWYTDFGGKGIKVTDSTPVFYNKAQYKQTLYAHFIPNEIIFDANGGEGYKQPLNYSSEIDLHNTYNDYFSYFTKESSVEFDGNGIGTNTDRTKKHTFLGWATTPNGEVVYTEEDIIDLRVSGYNGVGKVVLYAVWSVESIDAYKPSVEGYTFLGWTGADKKTVVWTGEGNFVIDGDITLYAKWRKNSFSFVYNSEGESYKEPIVRDIDNYDAPLWTNEFTRDGYDFMGWTLVSNENTVGFNDAGVLTNAQILNVMERIDNFGVVNLYAVWKGYSYSIAFDKNSDEVLGSIETVTAQYGSEKVLPSVSAFTAEEHKHFAGWALSPNGEAVYGDGESVINLTNVKDATIVLYAKWEYDKYNVVYTVAGVSVYTDEVSYNSSYTFKSNFDGFENYEAISYVNENYSVGQVIEQWTRTDNIYVEVEFSYDNSDNRFECNFNEAGEYALITGYNGPTNGILLIPHYIKQGDKSYHVEVIRDNAFASTPSRRLNFDAIYVPTSVETIYPRAFLGTQADSVYLTGDLLQVYRYAFSEMLYVDNFVMPTVALDDVAYGTNIRNLYYLGTIEQWENGALKDGVYYENLYFYYTYGPMRLGYNYWTYENGEIVELSI